MTKAEEIVARMDAKTQEEHAAGIAAARERQEARRAVRAARLAELVPNPFAEEGS